MTDAPTEQIAQAKARLENALDELEQAALALVRDRCLELSRRFPTRLVSYETGNGARTLQVARRKPLTYGSKTLERGVFDATWSWPKYVPPSPLLTELDELESDTRQSWLGTDCMYFLGGKQQ